MNREQQVMQAFRDLYQKLAWINKLTMEEALKAYKSSEVHCIEFIGTYEDVNVTRLAEAFYMTTGAISKLTKKLIAKGLVESYQRSDNRKEVYFRLTPSGQDVFRTHEGLHTEFQERDRQVFTHVTEAQYDSMLQFLSRYSQHLDGEIRRLRDALPKDRQEDETIL